MGTVDTTAHDILREYEGSLQSLLWENIPCGVWYVIACATQICYARKRMELVKSNYLYYIRLM